MKLLSGLKTYFGRKFGRHATRPNTQDKPVTDVAQVSQDKLTRTIARLTRSQALRGAISPLDATRDAVAEQLLVLCGELEVMDRSELRCQSSRILSRIAKSLAVTWSALSDFLKGHQSNAV